MIAEDLALLGRTAVHLRPSQFAHRARLQTQRAALHRWPKLGMRLLASAAGVRRARLASGLHPGGCPDAAVLAESRPGELRAGSLFWGSCENLAIRRIGSRPMRRYCGASTCTTGTGHGVWPPPPTATPPERIFARLWRSWQDSCAIGRGDAWLPYPAALRAWSWCGLYRDLVADSDMEPEFIRALFGHAAFLRHHLESDLGGNHLVKDLKALAGLGVFLGREQLLQRALRILRRQLAMQVLPDGGHYERAPAYHCQVLADLIDLSDLLRAAGRPRNRNSTRRSP